MWDSKNVDSLVDLYIHPEWENKRCFVSKFRWTWREEHAVRRKVDWKVMVRSFPFHCESMKADSLQAWVCVMFAALNIDRGNISNATSDNILDDLGMTQADYVSTMPQVSVDTCLCTARI